MLHPFVLGELWAGSNGMKCEVCEARTSVVWLTKEEFLKLPIDRSLASVKICQNKLGKVLCAEHGPLEKVREVQNG